VDKSSKRAIAPFDDYAQGVSESRELRKSNEAIGLRVRKGKLTLLSRKMFNVLMHHAQKLGSPGRNAPVVTEANKKYFWVPLADLARDAAYESNDTKRLKEYLQELKDIRIISEDNVQWTSQSLLSAFTLANPNGLKSRGGQIWVGFAFPPEVEAAVMRPDQYTNLAFVYQNQFRSGASLALYEICRRFLTNPSQLTARLPWTEWFDSVSGNPAGQGYPEYKIAKRDTFKPAIAEVNSVTDINIELIEHKLGRRVSELQFRVRKSEQAVIEFPAPPVVDGELLERVIRLGFSERDASDLVATNSENKIISTLQLVEERMAKKGAEALKQPAAYFKSALKNDWAPAVPKLEAPKIKPKANVETPEEVFQRYLAHLSKEAFSLCTDLEPEEQDRLIDEFKQQCGLPMKIRKDGLRSNVFRSDFSMWYAHKLWGEPSHQVVLEFALSNPKAPIES